MSCFLSVFPSSCRRPIADACNDKELSIIKLSCVAKAGWKTGPLKFRLACSSSNFSFIFFILAISMACHEVGGNMDMSATIITLPACHSLNFAVAFFKARSCIIKCVKPCVCVKLRVCACASRASFSDNSLDAFASASLQQPQGEPECKKRDYVCMRMCLKSLLLLIQLFGCLLFISLKVIQIQNAKSKVCVRVSCVCACASRALFNSDCSFSSLAAFSRAASR